MKPSTELFALIKSMSKSEKRFFKLNSAIQSGEKNYLKIFDFIEKLESYDEEQLKHHFKDETFVKHLPSEKNHLYKLILKSLRSYYSDQTVSTQLKEEIKNVEVLYNKALYQECSKFIKRSKRIAEDYEKFYYQFELISWEKRLLEESYKTTNFDDILKKVIEEEAEVISKLRNLAEYQILFSKINALFRSGGFTKNEEERTLVNEIANHPLIRGKNTALSKRAASICYYIKGLCAATNRDYLASNLFFSKTKEILDNNEKLKLDLGKQYIETLFHLMRCNLDAGDFATAQKRLDEIRGLFQTKGFKSIDLALKIRSVCVNEQLSIFNRQGDFESAILFLEKEENLLKPFEEKFSKDHQLQLLFNTSYAHFGNGEFKKALFFLNELLNNFEQHVRQDIYNFARILNVLIHFELNNTDLLEYEIISINRFIRKTKRDYNIETILIKYIRKIIRTNATDEHKVLFERLYQEMEQLFENHQETVILEYLDVFSWVESKINKTTFDKLVQKNQQRK